MKNLYYMGFYIVGGTLYRIRSILNNQTVISLELIDLYSVLQIVSDSGTRAATNYSKLLKSEVFVEGY